MEKYKLSVCLPARHEEFLKNTVEDILRNKEDATEVIVGLDGEWSDPPLSQHPDVNVVYVPEAIGQRAITNMCARLSRAHYIMKADSHCSFDKGFDRKMLEMFKVTGDDVTMLPIMRNLWVYDWECPKCGKREYQDRPDTCLDCGSKMQKRMIWEGKRNPQSTSYCFDSEPKFSYFEDWKHREPYITDKKERGLTETMSIQGSCFMITREKYWDLNVCDEALGNWGNQGIQVACATWLSGGRVLVNHNTWYAHCFRTKPEFGFSWPHSGKDQQRTKQNVRDLFWVKGHHKQIRPVSWLVEKFAPIKGWSEEDIKKLEETEFKPK